MALENEIILTEIKSKRIKWSGTPAPLALAYEKAMHASAGKRIYPENPYCEVHMLRENMCAIFSENADGSMNQWAYLIKGPEKALLIDNGFGVGNWKALCERLAEGRELLVTNTHASYDHSYGNSWFDKVYVHKYTVPALEALRNPHIWDYLFDENGNNIWLDFDRNDLPTEDYYYEIVGLDDHHIFDLGGGYEVEMIWMPGHMGGHCFFIDKRNKILFTGDGLECGRSNIAGQPKAIDPYGKRYCNVESMYRQFKKMLAEHRDEIESVFPAHGVLDLNASVLDGTLQGLERIMKTPQCPTRKTTSIRGNGKVTVQYTVNVPGFTDINYDPECVYAPKETVFQ